MCVYVYITHPSKEHKLCAFYRTLAEVWYNIYVQISTTCIMCIRCINATYCVKGIPCKLVVHAMHVHTTCLALIIHLTPTQDTVLAQTKRLDK